MGQDRMYDKVVEEYLHLNREKRELIYHQISIDEYKQKARNESWQI